MSNFKEIVTKAVIGKGKKASTNKYTLTPEEMPDTILGCWVINHQFQGLNNLNSVTVNGNFDINVWYSYDNDSKTAVSTKKYSYTEDLKLKLKEETDSDTEVIVRSLKQPTVSDVKINNGEIELTVDKELGIEVVGNTKIKVPIEDDIDDYEEIEDSSDLEEKIDQVHDNYLK